MIFGRKKTVMGKPNRKLLEQLYSLYEKQMYYLAYDILKNKHQAEDVIHDTFLKFLPYMDDISSPEAADTKKLLLRMTRNTAIDIYRKNQKETSLDLNLNQEDDRKLFTQTLEDKELIEEIFQTLSPEQREILKLRCFYGFSTKETAYYLNISEEAVRKRFWRARENVKAWKGDGCDEEGQTIKFNTL